MQEKKIQSKDVELFYIGMSDPAIDLLTEPVGRKELQEALTKMGIVNIYAPA